MLPIDHKVCSFFPGSNNQLNQPPPHNDFVSDMEYVTVNEIRAFDGYTIKSFEQLVALTGLVALRNRKYDLFFRGQSSDYKGGNGRTVIYPSICRPERNPNGGYQSRISTSVIDARYKQLKGFTTYLQQNQYRARFEEYYYALLQHYEILPTPLIDITQSLRVAATFALRNSQTGYLYVLGLPYPTGSISHFIDHNMVLVLS